MSPAFLACMFPLIIFFAGYGLGYFIGRKRLTIRSPIAWHRLTDLDEDESPVAEKASPIAGRVGYAAKR